MPSKTAANVAAVQVFGTLDGQEVMNDFYYRFAAQPTVEQLVELAGVVSDVWEEAFLEGLPNSWVGRSVYAFDMTVPDGANAVDDGIVGQVGTATGTPLPNNVSFAFARKNGLRGRSGNGRIFWMGLSVGGMADENSVLTGFITGGLSMLSTLDTAAEGLAGTPVILSFQNGGVASDEATIYEIANWVAVTNVVCSRRRRLPGRGV